MMTVGPGMDLPIMHDNDRYELVRDIGSGNFGVARLMRDRQTGELVAVKYIERGDKVIFSCRFYAFWFCGICEGVPMTWEDKMMQCLPSSKRSS